MKTRKKHILKYGMILLGNLFVAMGVVFFIVPGGLITGGVTGLALALEAFLHLPIAAGIALSSLLLFLVGFLFLGRDFTLSTLLSTVSYPLFVAIGEAVYPLISLKTDSMVLNLAGGIFFFAYGIAFIMRQGASSGGLDTISMILYRRAGVPMGTTVLIFEILSMLTQVPYATTDGILGGIVITVIYTALLNGLLARGIARIQVQIHSKAYEAIVKTIQTKYERGCTLFKVQGGYSREDTFAVQTVIANRELFRLKQDILKLDPHAFVTVSQVSEVNGLGFTYEK